MKRREVYKQIISEIAQQRIREDKCPSCEKLKLEWKRNTSYRCCSAKCTSKFWKELVEVRDWSVLREQCFERDGWKCVKCGKQPVTLVRSGYQSLNQKILKTEYNEKWGGDIHTIVDTLVGDHIVPIACNGDEWDLNNLQTLCIECNKIKTKEDMGKIAKFRQIEKVLDKNVSLDKFSSVEKN